MEKSSPETSADNGLAADFRDLMKARPSGLNPGDNGVSLNKNQRNYRVSLKNDGREASVSSPGGEIFPGSEEGNDLIAACLKELDTRTIESENEDPSHEQTPPFINSFLIEMIHRVKNALASIYHAALVTMDRPEDGKLRKEVRLKIKEDIRNIDSVLNSLLNFININTPITKTNTLPTLLEEVLEAHEKQLEEKGIRIVKKCRRDLPETYIHSEQVKFVLHSALQYIMFLTPPKGAIGILMRSPELHDDTDAKATSAESKGGYMEVVIVSNGSGKPSSRSENSASLPAEQKEASDLILILVKEILEKNRGAMSIETDAKSLKTLLTLKFPLERRNVVYYAPITL